uniref:F-box domain-containing protein n=1 Tax=Moniliophthora roreri TaxID=221103 RepID=A0A0W0FIM3_MONRR
MRSILFESAPDDEEPWRQLPLAALPIAIDAEADVVDILNVLPFDLIESIIDMCKEDRETIRSCSLVCREWVTRSRKHLLEMSCVRVNRVNADAFVELVGSPHFTMRNIPHLEFSFRGESSQVAEVVVPTLAKHRISIRSLVLVADTLGQGSCKKSFRLLSSTYKTSLTELSLRNHLPDKLFDILQFVYSFPRLEKLSLNGTFRGLVSPSKLPVHLRNFSFVNAPPTLRLSSLAVHGIIEGDIPALQKLLDTSHNDLRYLNLSQISINDAVLHFGRLHYLQHLIISPRIHTLECHPIQFIEKMLLTISSYCLKEIELHLPHIQIPHLDEAQCQRLDEAFTLSQFSDVGMLTIKSNPTAMVLLEKAFTTCQSKGILTLTIAT